jgi:molybdopterin molybdotransferase
MSLISFETALAQLLAAVQPIRELEWADTEHACGRTLASDVLSPIAIPALDTSTMDGYAVRTEDVTEAGVSLPIVQRIPAGTVGHALEPGTAARIFTGAPLPAGADAVVMQELCEHDHDRVIFQHRPHVGEAVRRAGSDIAQGSCVLKAGTRLGAQHIGVAAAIGMAQLPVWRRMRVALFSTGDELVMPGEPLPPGGVYNSNRYQLRVLLEQLGCTVTDFGIVPDRLDATRAALREAAVGHDLILTSGGVSVGEEDHVKPAVEAEGTLALWKIAIKPGKPLAFGHVGHAAFIGLPGNPVSSYVTFLMLVRPFILAAQGSTVRVPRRQRMTAAFTRAQADTRREFLRAQINEAGQLVLADNQMSSAVGSLAWAHGFVDVAPGVTVAAGDLVDFIPYSEVLS